MRRKFLLPAFAACAMLAIGAPVASASKAHVSSSKTAKAIAFLLKANKNRASEIGALRDTAQGYADAFKSIHSALDPIVAAAPQIVSGLTALKDGLTAISAALSNSTTGLVGLNLARPQFGVFNGTTGAILGGTGQATGASGPKTDASHPAGGTYIVDFGNDVSKRALSVAAAPGVGAVVGEAADCASPGAPCGADTSPNHVLVLTYVLAASATTANNATFTVKAISG